MHVETGSNVSSYKLHAMYELSDKGDLKNVEKSFCYSVNPLDYRPASVTNTVLRLHSKIITCIRQSNTQSFFYYSRLTSKNGCAGKSIGIIGHGIVDTEH